MNEAISAILTLAVGVAISPVPIIAVILMLFSAKARVNGPMFLAGWAIALTVVVAVAYVLAGAAATATEETTTDTIAGASSSWACSCCCSPAASGRAGPRPGRRPRCPSGWRGSTASHRARPSASPCILAGPNPKNLLLSIGAGMALAALELSTNEAVVSMLVYVLIGSSTILVPVVYYLVGGAKAKATLDLLKDWLAMNNTAVMAVLFLLFGVKLIAGRAPRAGRMNMPHADEAQNSRG